MAAGLVLAACVTLLVTTEELVEILLMGALALAYAARAARGKRSESSLLRDRERLSNVVEGLPLAAVAFDGDARVMTWNKNAERLFGWRADEVVGRENPIVPPGKRASSDELFRRLRAGERLNGVEVERVARDGTLLELALFTAPLRTRDGLLVLYADIRERKRAERALVESERRSRELIESLPLVTYVDRVDDHATNVYTSPQVEAMLGWSPDYWQEHPDAFERLLHPDDRERVMSAVHETNEQHGSFEGEYRMLHRDGHYVWVRDHSSIVAKDGEVPFARGFLLDITKQKRLEEQLLQSQKMDAIGQFAGGIAHDFNNMLTGISGYADLAAQSNPSPVVTRCLDGIRNAASEAASLTSRLLAFSRRHVPEQRLVDVNELVAQTADLLERLVREDVTLEISAAARTPVVLGDAAQLSQVILNLALNGRDAMPDGGVLTLETTRDGDTVVVRVRDTGIGMDDATRARALEPFFTTKPEGQGTGLGLAVAYAVVEGMGGMLTLTSQPGVGTTAEVRLPAATGLVTRSAAGAQVVARDERARILVVEDREVVRDLTREVLAAAGFDVRTAARATDALADERNAPFDLLLTDVVMPGMSGPELAARLRERDPELPVVFMSGYTDDVLEEYHLDAPRTAFVRKPFANADLVAAVRATLDGQPWASAAFANASNPASASAA